ncbi:MAG TPA: AAA family ATPase [Solirubrobacteraceae bacterium]|nr:AAA family ATPase [Solirubrobacteraceae bacterium]
MGGGVDRIELVSRDHELSDLAAVADTLATGAGHLVLIEGAAGTGKSSLLSELRRLTTARRITVAGAAAIELDRDVPFGVIDRIVGADGRDTAADFSLAALAEGGLSPVHATARAALELVSNGGLLLWLDDAQWADDPSMRVISTLAGATRDLPLTLAVTWRRGELAESHLRPLLALENAVRLTLADLDLEGSTELVKRLIAGADAEFTAACHRVTGGNPFLLRELVAAFALSGRHADAAAAETILSLTPAEVRREMLMRLGRLPPSAAALARAVAIVGDPAPLHHAAYVARLGHEDAAMAADELINVEILIGEDALSFRHQLQASAVLEDLGAFTRSALYRRAAEAMTMDGLVERAGAMLLRATPSGDPKVVSRLRRAAASAVRDGDARTAVRLLRRALEEPPKDPERRSVLLDLARAEAASGDPRSIEHLDQALPSIDSADERAVVLRGMARLHHARYEFPRAVRLAERALAELPPTGPVRDRLQAIWLFSASLDPDRHEQAIELLRALAEATLAGSPIAEPELKAQISLYLVVTNSDAQLATELAEQAIDDYAASNEDGLGLAADFALHVLLSMGKLAALVRGAGIVAESAQEHASMMGAAAAACWRAHARLHQADPAAAIGDAETGLLPRRHGWPTHATYSAGALALARLEFDDVGGAREAIALAAELPIPDPPRLYFEGLVELAAGQPAEASTRFVEAGEMMRRTWGVDSPAMVPWRSGAALAAVLARDADEAERLASDELQLARAARVPVAIGRALRARGLAVGGQQGIALLREACSTLASTESVLEQLRAQLDLGSVLRRAGARREAREVLRVVRARAAEHGCIALARRASEEQAASGARPRRVPVDGAESLTPSELRIARLAAAGASNREIAAELFLSPRTVEWHLGHVFTKLDVRSRRELAGALHRM